VPYIIWVSKDGDKRELYGEYISMRAANMKMNKLWESGEYELIGNMPKSKYEKEGFYKEGGMMADGGEIEDKFKGKNSKEIWNNLDSSTKAKVLEHLFLKGNTSGVQYYDSYNSLNELSYSDWDKLPKNIKNEIDNFGQKIKMADGGEINVDDKVEEYIEKLKNGESIRRYYHVRGTSNPKYFETIMPNKSEKGSYKRYESASKGSLGTLQNEYLTEKEVTNYLKKTIVEIRKEFYKDKMAKGGELTEDQQLKLRLELVLDDLKAIKEFIYENGLSEIFQRPTKHADECWTHFNNIEIACDLNDDESLSWGKFYKEKKAKGGELTEDQQFKLRLELVLDDLKAIKEFIYENGLSETFEKPTKHSDECWTLFNNIEIACDLNDDESLSWGKFYKEKGGYMAKGGSVNYGRSWTADRAKHNKSEDYEIPMKQRKFDHGGEVGQGFLIKDMREKLNRMFPDTFGFTVGNVSKEGNKTLNSAALIVDTNDPNRGLEDKDIQSKLFFPQYKRDHNINFRVMQGGENTYFYFALESEKGDEYIGQFGFKDQGDVSSDYITRFIAFLMEQYGLPFEVKHSVMAKGGYMASGGEMHKADYFKDGGKVFSEKELKEILDEALSHFYQGLNKLDTAMRYLEVKGQGGLRKPLSDKLKLDGLKESIEKIDEYISK
jgi:CRISPR/Cas system-associated exonuclease Cas4 (RecB family)